MDRKSRLLTVILLISMLPSLFGAHLDMMIGNDNKTFGIGRNLDDGRSFGSEIDLEYQEHHVHASMTGFTVKGYRLDDLDIRGRYDSFDIGYGYIFNWNPGRENLFLEPSVGFNLIGNLGMEEVQNAVHEVLGRKTVHLPYDYGNVLFYPAIGLDFCWLHGFTDDFSLGLSERFSYRIHFGLSNEILLLLRLGDSFDLGFGYAYERNLTGERRSYEVQAIRDTGFVMSSSIHAGLFTIEYHTNFSQHVSYGLLGLNPLAFMDMESFLDTGRSVALGREWGYPGYMHRITITDHNWQLRSKYRTSEIEVGSEKRVANSSFALGYSFIWELGHFSPFISPWGGMSQYVYFRQNWNSDCQDILIEHYMPTVGVDAGVRMLQKGTICIGGSSFSIDAGVSLGLNIGAGNVDLNGYEEFRKRVSPVEARVFLDLVLYI